MGVQIKHAGNTYMPIILCDYCGKPITDASWASVLWVREHPEQVDYKPIFAHKRCDTTNNPKWLGYSEELTVFLSDLEYNTNIDQEEGESGEPDVFEDDE